MRSAVGLLLGLLVCSPAAAQDVKGAFRAGDGYARDSAAQIAAEKARFYQVEGLYPDFSTNGLLSSHVALKQDFYVRKCVTVSKEPLDRTCEVRSNVREEILWRARPLLTTVHVAGNDLTDMTWTFAAQDRSTVVKALDDTFGPLPDPLAAANPRTWCAFQGVFTLEEGAESLTVRFRDGLRSVAARDWQNGICGEQNATDDEKLEKEFDVIGARVRAARAVNRLRR